MTLKHVQLFLTVFFQFHLEKGNRVVTNANAQFFVNFRNTFVFETPFGNVGTITQLWERNWHSESLAVLHRMYYVSSYILNAESVVRPKLENLYRLTTTKASLVTSTQNRQLFQYNFSRK